MIQEVYDWLESRSGSPYDFRDELSELELSEAFLSPGDWFNTISITIDRLEDCVDDINKFRYEIPEDLPDADDMKKQIIGETTEMILDKLDEVKQRIGIKASKVKNVNELTTQLSMICKMIDICKNAKIQDVMGLLSKFEEDHDFYMSDNFDITPKDYPQLYADIVDIIEEYEEDNEE